ncbi:MAG: hypothetical protein NC433_17350 [Clostridiales bacterium]|nr:hypothetical protein [Clostridiales bacterium]
MQVKIAKQENLVVNTNLPNEKAEKANRHKETAVKRKNTIFAGELPMNKDSVAVRREQAKKRARKFVQDAWSGDKKMDQSQTKIRETQKLQRAEALDNQKLVKECMDRKENLRQKYGVDMDSQEQKDLELLTEYQQQCMEINEEQFVFECRQQNADGYADYLQSALTDMKLERLKYHKMEDAQANAEKVMEKTGQEIQGLLIEEAKSHVDETYDEKREEAKKNAEKKEAQEEKIELRKEQKELMEAKIEAVRADSREAKEAQREQKKDAREEAALLNDMAEAGLDVAGAGATVKAEIKEMLNKLKLVEADIKGIEVDEEI